MNKEEPSKINNLEYTLPFWIYPGNAFILVVMIPSIVAYILPESIYMSSWETPKYFDTQSLLYSLLFSIVFYISSTFVSQFIMMAVTSKSRSKPEYFLPNKLLKSSFYATFYITISAYLLWWTLAISRGLNINLVLGVLTGVQGSIYKVKREYFETLPGITTLTEVGILFGIISGILAATHSWKIIKKEIIIVTLFVVARVFLNSERVSLISFYVPALISALRMLYLRKKVSRFYNYTIQYLPLISIPLLLLFFTITEYFRSWITYNEKVDSLFLFSFVRLLGYYITALNNSILYIKIIDTLPFPYWTIQAFWKLPVIDSILTYKSISGIDTSVLFGGAQGLGLLGSNANPEFNNAAGIYLPILDFGLLGATLFWLLAGIIAGILFNLYRSAKVLGIIMYPIIYIGIIEVSRLFFLHGSRGFVVLISAAMLLFIYFYNRAYKR